ncbi:beta-ketoacyl-ACP reductase [Nocardioides sp. WV_118_6]
MSGLHKGTHLGRSKLDGRVALVTGGTRGIGASICRSLASQGAIVAAGYSGNEEAAHAFAEELRTSYPDATFSVHRGNIGEPADCRRVVDEVLAAHGRLDILVNNAGITLDKTFLKMTDEEWHKVVSVNLSGAFFMSQPALRHMLERGTGRVVNVSSIVGEIGNIGQTNYAASKSGLIGMTKSLAREVSFLLQRADKLDDGVGLTVNVVSPGVVDTEMVQQIPDRIREGLVGQIPVQRFGDPEEIARVVHFLCADESSFITGQVWSVNGGMDM